MKNNSINFFLIFSFIVAQFFTQQLHDLTHLLSNDSEPEIADQHYVNDATKVSFQEKHEHCKFLQLILNQHAQPFLLLDSNEQLYTVTFQNPKPAKNHNWISYNDSSYHQARAPPVV